MVTDSAPRNLQVDFVVFFAFVLAVLFSENDLWKHLEKLPSVSFSISTVSFWEPSRLAIIRTTDT